VEIELNNVAQVVFALLIGVAAVLRALTGFLPFWRARKDHPTRLDPGSSSG
jgi:hypothetical protein